MDKREFFEFLRDEIIEAMPELENAQFFTREVKKDNNRVYNALNIKRPELSISPSYNFDSLYNEYERTGDMYTIISLIKSGFENMPNLREMNIDLNDYDSRNKTLVNALSHENQQKFREMTGEISHDSEMRHEEKARKNLYLKNKEQKERAK